MTLVSIRCEAEVIIRSGNFYLMNFSWIGIIEAQKTEPLLLSIALKKLDYSNTMYYAA